MQEEYNSNASGASGVIMKQESRMHHWCPMEILEKMLLRLVVLVMPLVEAQVVL